MNASPAVIETISALIGFRTPSEQSNLALIRDVAGRLDPIARIRILPDETGTKANLFASIGPDVPGGVILSGHSDVVPAPACGWRSDPFSADVRNGRLYGRGACDMKGFLGVAIGLAPALAAMPLRRPIHIAVSYDEEIGCVGVWGIANMIRAEAATYDAIIVGEPTMMAPVIGHKGKTSWLCEVKGRAAHTSLAPRAVNAVELAARMITRIADLGEARARSGPFDPMQDPPHSTLSTGPIAGGKQLNVVAEDCRFEFEMRYLPEDAPSGVLADLQAYAAELESAARTRAPEAAIRLVETNTYPGFAIDASAPVVRLAERLSGRSSAGRVAFGTEAGIFAQAGIPTIVCGPGSIEQAHTIDEFVALEQIAACERFVMGIGETLCRSDGW